LKNGTLVVESSRLGIAVDSGLQDGSQDVQGDRPDAALPAAGQGDLAVQ
jgi:hypothetical protein